jgi:DNA replication protein DnaC
MIDDLGKEKSTPAMAALLWEVLDKRYGRGLPLVITTRFSGAELRQRYGEECLGDDIVRRLNELCTGVLFALPSDRAG